MVIFLLMSMNGRVIRNCTMRRTMLLCRIGTVSSVRNCRKFHVLYRLMSLSCMPRKMIRLR